MLARVAENIYWMARHVERAENTARLVGANTLLLLDLPRDMAPGWEHLLIITGVEKQFRRHHKETGEQQVIQFLLASKDNPGSVLNSLQAARENCRTIRDFVPREAWERLNALFLYCKDNVHAGRSKRGRHGFLAQIVSACQTLTGMLAGTMNHDDGYQFLRIGRNLERADMTSRIIDARTSGRGAGQTPGESGDDHIQWLSVLQSLSAEHMYRRTVQVRIQREAVLRFLVLDPRFPRAISHCLHEIERSVQGLSGDSGTEAVLRGLQVALAQSRIEAMGAMDLHRFLDQIQLELGQAHDAVAERFFLPLADADPSQGL